MGSRETEDPASRTQQIMCSRYSKWSCREVQHPATSPSIIFAQVMAKTSPWYPCLSLPPSTQYSEHHFMQQMKSLNTQRGPHSPVSWSCGTVSSADGSLEEYLRMLACERHGKEETVLHKIQQTKGTAANGGKQQAQHWMEMKSICGYSRST